MLKSVKSVKSSFLKKRTFDFMGKAIGIDFGLKRTGFAISDDSGIIASPMETIDSRNLPDYLNQIISREKIHLVVIGFPTALDGSDTDITENVRQFQNYIKGKYPQLEVVLYDERLTSKIAHQAFVQISKKQQRRNKGHLDKMSAAIILQDYLNSRS